MKIKINDELQVLPILKPIAKYTRISEYYRAINIHYTDMAHKYAIIQYSDIIMILNLSALR